MLTLGIRYLNGFVVASHGRHELLEWPPHPGRFFMALVAAHYETGADPAEREALLWLERLSEPPEVHAPEACPRTTVTQYVPVNDKTGPSTAPMHSLPLTRDRKDRTFARAWLTGDTAFVHWPQADPPPGIRAALEALCAKTTRIGHSSSLVQVWLADQPSASLPRWVPDSARATIPMRVPVPGTLQALDEDFQQRHERARDPRDQSKSRSPVAGKRPLAEHGYALAAEAAAPASAPGTVFSPHLLLFDLERLDGPYRHLDLASTLSLTARWREALTSHANDLSAEAQQIICGHTPDHQPFDQHPKAKDKAASQQEAAELIAAACGRIGLPRPREVILTPVSAHLGALPAHAFPRLRRKDGTERRHSHAILAFAEPVRGPVLIGAGRYRGYGVFRPMIA